MPAGFATAHGLPFPVIGNNVLINFVVKGIGRRLRGMVSFKVSEILGKIVEMAREYTGWRFFFGLPSKRHVFMIDPFLLCRA